MERTLSLWSVFCSPYLFSHSEFCLTSLVPACLDRPRCSFPSPSSRSPSSRRARSRPTFPRVSTDLPRRTLPSEFTSTRSLRRYALSMPLSSLSLGRVGLAADAASPSPSPTPPSCSPYRTLHTLLPSSTRPSSPAWASFISRSTSSVSAESTPSSVRPASQESPSERRLPSAPSSSTSTKSRPEVPVSLPRSWVTWSPWSRTRTALMSSSSRGSWRERSRTLTSRLSRRYVSCFS
jgi:hypothetical protein